MLCKRVLVLAVFVWGFVLSSPPALAGFGEVLVGEGNAGPGYDDFGEPVFRMTGFVTRDTKLFRDAFQNEALLEYDGKIEYPSLVYPRDRTHRLGTVFRLSERFETEHDPSFAASIGSQDLRRGTLSGALITGLMRTETMEKMVVDGEPHRAQVQAKLDVPTPKRITRAMMTVFVEDLQVILLSKQERQRIAAQVTLNAKADQSDTFYIATSIISASRIRYYIGPAWLKGHDLNRNPAIGVTEHTIRQDRTRNLSGVYEITHDFPDRKIVAVGYSLIANATRRGRSQVKMHNEIGGFGDHFFRHSKRANLRK